MHFRKPESLKSKLDTLVKKYGTNKITIEHGCACYEFHHYDYEEPSWKNNWESTITIYVVDFWNGKVVEFGTYTEKDLAKPTYDELDWGCYDKIFTFWEKQFPTIIEIREYR